MTTAKKTTKKRSSTLQYGTTFDDVFRTICLKLPQLIVPLINETFGENYPDDVKVVQLRNEFVSEKGKIITDSIFFICGKYYHIECQSSTDRKIEIRMIRYDFEIAYEHAERTEQGYTVRFPESAVLYLRHDSKTPDKLTVKVEMPDGQITEYSAKVIKAQRYTREEIFKKKLLGLVPFYLMRYEKESGIFEKDRSEREEFLAECARLRDDIGNAVGTEEAMYNDLINLVLKVSDHILAKSPKTKKGVRSVMGGKVLTLSSEKLIKKGLREGRREGRQEGQIDTTIDVFKEFGQSKENTIRRLVDKFNLSPEDARDRVNAAWN